MIMALYKRAFAILMRKPFRLWGISLLGTFLAGVAGVAFGMGYAAYGVIILLGMGLVFLGLSGLTIFDHAAMRAEKLLKVPIPESLNYAGVFDDIFARYLKSVESAGVARRKVFLSRSFSTMTFPTGSRAAMMMVSASGNRTAG